MTKRYRKISSWLRDVEKALKHPAQKIDESDLPQLGWSFGLISEQLVTQPELTPELLRLLDIVRNASGAGRVVFERHVLEGLAFLASRICSMIYDATIFPKPLATVSAGMKVV